MQKVMGTRLVRWLGVFLVVALLVPVPAARAADVWQNMLDRFLKAEKLPGGVLLVSDGRTRKVVVSGVADRRNNTPVTADTRFYVASIGKMAVATAILQMVDEGRLTLDAPVAPLVEGIPGIDRLANIKKVKLRHLLEHTSGIPDYLDDAFEEAQQGNPNRRWAAAASIAYAFGQPATGRPGKTYEYCNSNYVLLGHIAETVDGAALADVLQRRVFDRAGMTDAVVGPRPDAPRLARGYSDLEGDGRLQDTSLLSWNAATGDGPMTVTAEDLEHFLFALFRDNRLMRPATLKKMIEPRNDDAEYALGVELGEDDNGEWVGHTGSYDGFEAEARYYPDRQAVVIFLTNGDQESEDGSLPDKAATALFRGR